MNTYTKIQYWNSCNADIHYKNGFKQTLYLDADLVNPTWELDEEGQEDGDREFVRSFGKIKKWYNCEFVCPQYLLEALTFMQIHDNVYVILKTGEEAKIKNLRIESQWIFKNTLAQVQMSFYIDFLKTECCQARLCSVANHDEIDGRYNYDSIQWTDPATALVPNGRRYLFYATGTEYLGEIYTFNRGLGLWVVESQVNGDIVEFGEISMYLDTLWLVYPTINVSGFTLTGYAIPGSLVQAENYDGANWQEIGEPVTDGVYSGTGLVLNPLDLVTPFVRVHCYNHSCDYGVSEFAIVTSSCEKTGTFTDADLVGGLLEINHDCNSVCVVYCNIIDPQGNFEMRPVTLGDSVGADTSNYVTVDFGASIGAGTFKWDLITSDICDTFTNGDLVGGKLLINHSLNTQNILYVNIIDPDGKFEYAPVSLGDLAGANLADNVTVDFGGAIGVGTFRYVLMPAQKYGTFVETDLSGGRLAIHHNLNSEYVLFVNVIDPNGVFELVPCTLGDLTGADTPNHVTIDLGAIGAGTFRWCIYVV